MDIWGDDDDVAGPSHTTHAAQVEWNRIEEGFINVGFE